MRRLDRRDCSILPLVLKGKWFDMIASGEKREEYREYKPYWRKRLANWDRRGSAGHKWSIVAFSRGYQAPSMFFIGHVEPCPYGDPYPISTLTPNVAWGQPRGLEHYRIMLIERVELEEEAPNGKYP